MKKLITSGVIFAASLFPIYSLAATECTVKVIRIFSGDEGYVWLFYQNGGSAYLLPSDPDLKNTLALATVALTTGNSVAVRYLADGVACTSSGRSDFVGMHLFNAP